MNLHDMFPDMFICHRFGWARLDESAISDKAKILLGLCDSGEANTAEGGVSRGDHHLY